MRGMFPPCSIARIAFPSAGQPPFAPDWLSAAFAYRIACPFDPFAWLPSLSPKVSPRPQTQRLKSSGVLRSRPRLDPLAVLAGDDPEAIVLDVVLSWGSAPSTVLSLGRNLPARGIG